MRPARRFWKTTTVWTVAGSAQTTQDAVSSLELRGRIGEGQDAEL